ncbi:MAG: cytochrome c3 family protein [Candidatus Sumerlaeota bacterium]|nr:cytochrome c3 family protein [Candidatus Sumerlaeota bacterium]
MRLLNCRGPHGARAGPLLGAALCLSCVIGVSTAFFAESGGNAPAPAQTPAFDRRYNKACDDSSCHPVKNAGRIPTHSPYLEGQCLVCHVDHQSAAPNLLKEGGDALCRTCHNDEETTACGALAHPPQSPPCLACHAPHQSRDPGLTRGEGPLRQCAQCHEPFLLAAERLPYRHLHLDPRGQCADCHYAHRRGAEKYLRENVADTCLTCHDLPLRVDNREIENVGAEIRDSADVHGALKTPPSCPACHTPHGSAQPALLKAGYPAGSYEEYRTEDYALCWQCHSKELAESGQGAGATRFYAGTTNLHRLHVVELRHGRACHLCHEAHASSTPHLLRAEATFGQWTAPLIYEPLADGGRCQTPCHREREYHRGEAARRP